MHWIAKSSESRPFARHLLVPLLCALVVCSFSFPAAASAPAAAAASGARPVLPPVGDRWFSIVMNGERTGFAHTRIVPGEQGYEIDAEGSVKMAGFGFSREASSHEQYLVNRDLSLRSFTVEQVIDGTPMKVKGEVAAKGIKISVESKGKKKERLLKTMGAVFPPPVLNIYPLMHGIKDGKAYRLQMLDVEEAKLKDVKITAVGVETMTDGAKVFHLQNDLYSFVSNDIWIDLAGNTVRESVRDGMIETRAEPEQTGKTLLVEDALAKKDFMIGFSRILLDEPLSDPKKLQYMKVDIAGFPETVPLLEGGGQQATRSGGDLVLVAVTRQKLQPGGLRQSPEEFRRFTAASEWIPSTNGEIQKLKDEVLKGEADPVKAVEKLNRWIAENTREVAVDNRSPLAVLNAREGNCQSRARLYVSLARAAGIATRLVSGLVYVPDHGFLYHSWAESFVGEWVPVDPNRNEAPADATHVKVAEGDSPGDAAPIMGLIGRIRMKMVEKRY